MMGNPHLQPQGLKLRGVLCGKQTGGRLLFKRCRNYIPHHVILKQAPDEAMLAVFIAFFFSSPINSCPCSAEAVH